MTIDLAPYDPADYLMGEETIAAYMLASRESNDSSIIAKALETVERARRRDGSTIQETIKSL